jgi:kinesin family protein 2/24
MSGTKGTPTKAAAPGAGVPAVKDQTALAIQRIKQQREDRRRSAEHFKRERHEEVARIEASGVPVFDADFQRMISTYRAGAEVPRPHAAPGEHEICVVVRKRPINKREVANRDWDSVHIELAISCSASHVPLDIDLQVTCLNPRVVVHAPKLKVDGITKYLENTPFEFDHVRSCRANTYAS